MQLFPDKRLRSPPVGRPVGFIELPDGPRRWPAPCRPGPLPPVAPSTEPVAGLTLSNSLAGCGSDQLTVDKHPGLGALGDPAAKFHTRRGCWLVVDHRY